MMRIQVDPPRWTRLRALVWVGRGFGMTHAWEAVGRRECDLLTDLLRLGRRRNFIVVDTEDGAFQLVFADNKTHEVRS